MADRVDFTSDRGRRVDLTPPGGVKSTRVQQTWRVRSYPVGRQPIVVLGEFDGFHVGHRQLVHLARRRAQREERPLIAVVMDDGASTGRLMTPAERSVAALAHGIDAAHVVAVPADVSQVGAPLVEQVVVRLSPRVVMMACLPDGPDTARFPVLRDALRARQIHVDEVDRWFDVDRRPVTSRRIREAIANGDVARAHAWLGSPYTLSGEVVHGSGLGHTIGFPTANVDPPAGRAIPTRGVYSAVVSLPDGRTHAAAVNVGVRPTVEQHGALLVEAHLLDFDEDIYGQRIDIGFRQWLREEVAFGSVDVLIDQLGLDAARARMSLGR